MEKKKFEELGYTEQHDIAKLFACWLRPYTHEVVVRVLARRDEILANDSAMSMLRELYQREQDEAKDELSFIKNLLENFETFKVYDIHNHPLTHSESYRDVLYDLYISTASK